MKFHIIEKMLQDWFGSSDSASKKSSEEDYEEARLILNALKSLFEKELELRNSNVAGRRDKDDRPS
jgi:hypothetical protein